VVKFLSGSQYTGEAVPLCTFWRDDVRTDPTQELSQIEGTGFTFSQADAGQNSAIGEFDGQCIANAFFPKSTITCFNEGQCNGEGKCLPCSRYRYGGMKMAITHSPPPEVLKFFGKGLTDDEIKSPNLVRFPPSAAQAIVQDQLPYHVLIRNIQAEIAKCCHWNADTGVPAQFFLATIRNGPDVAVIQDAEGNDINIKGIRVINDAFPDEVGTFFPVGTTVVAGWLDQPSFFLEPRTGLIRTGEDIIFNFDTGEGVDNSPTTVRTKQIASDSNTVVDNAVNAAIFACQTAQADLAQQAAFFNGAFNTNDPATIATAQAKLDTANANVNTACTASTDSTTVGQEAIDLIADTITSDSSELQANGIALADKLDELADLVETAGSVVTGSAADSATTQVRLLRINARTIRFSAAGGNTRCEFFFTDENVAEQWNAPVNGTLPCNGIRTDCDFYSGKPWIHATDELMEIGRPVLAEQIQEVRFRSENWARFVDPEEEFRNRFTTPFIWAFKDYVDVSGEPDPSDPNQMLLFKPKVLFARGGIFSGYQQIRMDKVEIGDLSSEEFSVEKSEARTQPGSETLDKDSAPPFPSLISEPVVPSATRLSITHPRPEDEPFVYRFWTPEKNLISLFGLASPDQTIYIVNNTALRRRNQYHQQFGTKNFFDIPTSLPLAPDFQGLTATRFIDEVVQPLQNEKETNSGLEAPLGFDVTTSDRSGFWQSINEVELVHNEVNEIYAFLVATETSILVSRTTVEARFLHAIVSQTAFEGTDFSMLDVGASNSSQVGINSTDTATKGIVRASPMSYVGDEEIQFNHGYYAWRFIDRGLQFGTLNADNDLQGQNPIADQASSFLVTSAAPSEFVVNVGYHVVEYEINDQEVSADDWYLIDDCGTIMVRIADPNIHRVLPLPNQQGNQVPLTNILRNEGSVGSEIAQWGLTKAVLNIEGQGEKPLVQFYRDPDGLGLPANYVILGPNIDESALNAFGRPEPGRDTITISYKFIRAQSTEHVPTGGSPEDTDLDPPQATVPEVVTADAVNLNFNQDNLRTHRHLISFDVDGNLIAGGNTFENRISQDQQDYVWVFADSEGRPIGKKNIRFYVMYYNLTCINVEIFYRWLANCTTYALIPDLFTRIGDAGGTVTSAPAATDDPNDDRLALGFRIKNLLGDRDCIHQPNCGDHELLRLGPLRREFEVIVRVEEEGDDGEITSFLKANFPSAGGPIEGEIISSERPGSQFLKRQGPMWYPYTACERPRYQFTTNGPLNTDSTELINTTIANPGLPEDPVITVGAGGALSAGQGGTFGALPDQACEAYQGPTHMVAKILDVHPSLRPCTSAYTYGNQILKSGETRFAGYGRRRGFIDTFLYQGLDWTPPPFGNFGRSRLVFELSSERGDYLGGFTGSQVGRRWMPMFPTRPNLGATVGLFSEELEHAAYRLLGTSTPVGSIFESIPSGSSGGNLTILGAERLRQKALIANRTLASIEFPFSPYFPMFLPDEFIGTDAGGRVPIEEQSLLGAISTTWAWRESEKKPQRAVLGTNILTGISLALPDYFIDNRRLEVRLRPTEGSYVLTWTPPQYNLDGTLSQNASLKLGDGPPREIVVDFVDRTFGPAFQEDTVYDFTKQIGEGAFECEPKASDNSQISAQCSCITDITDPELESGGEGPGQLPSRFLHLDELAPEGFVALYNDTVLRTPFLIDLARTSNIQPCCMCLHYITGIFFALNGNHIPSVTNINPARDSRLEMQYTWSRVPHGIESNSSDGKDDVFNSFEQLADTFVDALDGDVFSNYNPTNRGRLDASEAAIFPSPALAQSLTFVDADGNLSGGISVLGVLDPGDIKFGGAAADDSNGISRGQSEQIILAMLFNTYVKVTNVVVTFFAGSGFEAPQYRLAVVPPANRVNNKVTLNLGLVVGEALGRAFEGDIPNIENLESDDLQDGRAKFRSRLIPSLDGLPFWEQYGMEWQLIFPSRGSAQSMGISSIEVTCDALTTGGKNTEVIGVRERKYYRSIGTITNENNPERFFGEMDSATAYWRSTDAVGTTGHNRHRAYAWGAEITDDQEPIASSDVALLESLQEQEYDLARGLLGTPYQFIFSSFTPLDEEKWLNLLAEGPPNWTFTSTMEIGAVDAVTQQTSQQLLYGSVPERQVFNAPGHAWVHNFEETYTPCCFGCAYSMIVDYDFIHLHDNLALVETAGFWSELPSGFTRLIRSTIMLPDPNFTGAEAGVGTTVLLNESAFIDAQGNAISVEVLNAAGFTQDPTTGQYYVDGSEPGGGVGGPVGPLPDCGV
jgi:hypothetical protein